jgi:ABC-2 type transport system permease protein
MTAPRTTAGGSIYDLGYRHYEGARLGRRHAFLALYTASLRQLFGLGRGARSKLIPWGLTAMTFLPAVIALAITAVVGTQTSGSFGSGGAAGGPGVGGPGAGGPGAGGGSSNPLTSLIGFSGYYGDVSQFLFLFVAAQAPELLGRDQRFHVLTLYFSRALRRSDYALARFSALTTALFGILVLPQVLLFLGRGLAADDVAATLLADLPSLPPVVAQAVVVALLLSSLGLASAAFSPRRAYAAAAIIAAIIVPPIVAAVVQGGDLGGYVRFISVSDILDRTAAWWFGTPLVTSDVSTPLSPGLAVIMAVVGTAFLLAILLRRYARIAA